MSLTDPYYIHRTVPQRAAEVVAEFPHPATDAPMVTWYQTSDFRDEEPEFFTISKREFLSRFKPKGEL